MSSLHPLQFQLKFINLILKTLFGKHHSLSNEAIHIILDFLFSSPHRRKNTFVLKQGHLILNYDQQSHTQSLSNKDLFRCPFVLSPYNQQIFITKQTPHLSQNTHFILTNRFIHNQRVKITKIWPKPPTKTQKKILTYCTKFKQFLLGQHLSNKTIDLRFLKRQFLIPFHQTQQFYKNLKNIQQNDATFCSYDVIDSYMALVTKNYIEIEIQLNQFNEKDDKIYKIIPQNYDLDLMEGVKVKFDQYNKKWLLQGQEMTIWQGKNVWSRKKTLIRTLDGKVDCVEGHNKISVASVQISYQ